MGAGVVGRGHGEPPLRAFLPHLFPRKIEKKLQIAAS